jgi:hypothetical protein
MNSFEQRVKEYQSSAVTLEGELKKISTMRLLVFLGSATLITVLANDRQAELLFVFVPLCVVWFAALVKRHNSVANQLSHNQFLQRVNEHEVARLNNDFSQFPDGIEFFTRHHSYTSDLDIFGKHSVFQMLNRTTMHRSQRLLANWLSRCHMLLRSLRYWKGNKPSSNCQKGLNGVRTSRLLECTSTTRKAIMSNFLRGLQLLKQSLSRN